MEYLSKKFCLRKGKKVITDATVSYFAARSHGIIDKQREHSLRCFPSYPSGLGIQEYLSLPGAHTLAEFRLGDAGLGNRNSPSRDVCPLCRSGVNKESHLVFDCPATGDLRKEDDVVMVFLSRTSAIKDSDEKLKLFVGGDFSSNEVLQKRCAFLKVLQDKHRCTVSD